ncbi:hypothetical protein B0H13DRAFT_2493074 [Mycena leptocephala]|nr:hypothetical protein B0H13DRAFT_2493074 [Mycena leptocephala]
MCFEELAIAIKSAEGLSAHEGAKNLKLEQSVAGNLKESSFSTKGQKIKRRAYQWVQCRSWKTEAKDGIRMRNLHDESKATRHDDKAVEDEVRIKQQSLKEDERHLQTKSSGDRKLERARASDTQATHSGNQEESDSDVQKADVRQVGKKDKSRIKKRHTKIQVIETGGEIAKRWREAARRGRGFSSAAIWNKTERTWYPTKPAFWVMTGRRDRQRTEEAGFPSKDRNGEVAKRGGGRRQRVEADVGGGGEAWQREADGIVIWGKEGGPQGGEGVGRESRVKQGGVTSVGLNPSQLGSTAGKRGRRARSPGPRQSAGEGGPREEEGVGRESHITSKGKERGGLNAKMKQNRSSGCLGYIMSGRRQEVERVHTEMEKEIDRSTPNKKKRSSSGVVPLKEHTRKAHPTQDGRHRRESEERRQNRKDSLEEWRTYRVGVWRYLANRTSKRTLPLRGYGKWRILPAAVTLLRPLDAAARLLPVGGHVLVLDNTAATIARRVGAVGEHRGRADAGGGSRGRRDGTDWSGVNGEDSGDGGGSTARAAAIRQRTVRNAHGAGRRRELEALGEPSGLEAVLLLVELELFAASLEGADGGSVYDEVMGEDVRTSRVEGESGELGSEDDIGNAKDVPNDAATSVRLKDRGIWNASWTCGGGDLDALAGISSTEAIVEVLPGPLDERQAAKAKSKGGSGEYVVGGHDEGSGQEGVQTSSCLNLRLFVWLHVPTGVSASKRRDGEGQGIKRAICAKKRRGLA